MMQGIQLIRSYYYGIEQRLSFELPLKPFKPRKRRTAEKVAIMEATTEETIDLTTNTTIPLNETQMMMNSMETMTTVKILMMVPISKRFVSR